MYKIFKVGLLSFLVSIAASAATIAFGFTSSGGTVGGSSPFVNTRTYTNGIYSVTASSFSLPGNLAGAGFGTRNDDDSTASSNARAVSLGGGIGNELFFAARLSGNGADNYADYFKIESLSVNTAVPEPTTFGLAGLALVGLGLVRKRASKS